MLFNSLIFIIFAAAFFGLWPRMKRHNTSRWLYLTIASFIFYGWWDWRFCLLLFASGTLDFWLALAMQAYPRFRRLLLVLSLVGNIGTLAVFKYSSFLLANLEQLLQGFGIESNLQSTLPDFFLLLPIGISFYTFQSLSYTIDVYRGNLEPTSNFWHFFAYLSMFPQLVAGPIIRASDLLPQLTTYHNPDEQERWDGLKLIVHGFFKKMVIADNLAPSVTLAFANVPFTSGSPVFWWLIITAFAVQIYCDFSGYSDIARGLATWMGYRFPLNFDHPYTATSMREFWSRWHMSLSTWFRDYVYIPLGGSRVGVVRAYASMFITMLVAGLWHGAAWTFVAWGAVHGVFLAFERLTRWPDYVKRLPAGRWVAVACVLFQVWIAWVFFRAESIGQAVSILMRLFGLVSEPFQMTDFVLLGYGWLFWMAVMIVREFFYFLQPPVTRFTNEQTNRVFDVVSTALLIVITIYFRGPSSEFVYFQF